MGCISSKQASSRAAEVSTNGRIQQSDNNNETLCKQDDYTAVDNHARKASHSLKNSPQALVKYLQQASTEPRMVARAIFVWISENIRYDVDGYLGVSARGSQDVQSVMKSGKSVCQGYANVMEALCSEAGIPVKLITGYAKGFGHSADQPITTNIDTNHAWNAIQLEGKWYLVDSTWGAGHIDRSNIFVKQFEMFYFLANPKHIISSHFPYMDKNMEESKKWQLLKRPVSLEEFNKTLKMKPLAFELTFCPISHKHGLIRMKMEEEFTFRSEGNLEIDVTAVLRHMDGNMLIEQPRSVFVKRDGTFFKVKVHPNKTGTFNLTMFGKHHFQTGNYSQLCEYVVKCEKNGSGDFEFPEQYSIEDGCELIKPMQYKLKANSEVEFHLSSPYFLRVMVKKTFLEKTGTSFKGTFKTGHEGESLTLYGSRESEGSLKGLFTFSIL